MISIRIGCNFEDNAELQFNSFHDKSNPGRLINSRKGDKYHEEGNT
jgi:hypothetical protein